MYMCILSKHVVHGLFFFLQRQRTQRACLPLQGQHRTWSDAILLLIIIIISSSPSPSPSPSSLLVLV